MTNIRLDMVLALSIGAVGVTSASAAPVIGAGGVVAMGGGAADRVIGEPVPGLSALEATPAGIAALDGSPKTVVLTTIALDGSVVPVAMPMPERSASLAEFRLPQEFQWVSQASMQSLFGEQSMSRLRARVPELSTWAMMIAGLGLVGLFVRRRRGGLPVSAD